MKNTHAKGARWLLVIGVAALVGLIDSAYLTVYHYIPLPLMCTSFQHGCAAVLHSSYAMVGPVPLAAFGIAFYLTVLLATLAIHRLQLGPRALYALLVLTGIGFCMSIIFESTQAFIIHALCQYCALSALSSTVQFLCAARIIRTRECTRNRYALRDVDHT